MQYADGCNKGEVHVPEMEEDLFWPIYFEATDYFVVSLKERSEQPTYVIYAVIESFLLSITDGKTPDLNGMKMIQENYSDEVYISSFDVEMAFLKQLFKDAPVVCFSDIVDKLRLLPDERQLILNIVVLCNLLLINPATSATPER